jgi:photosystem II stability/assembly factor-like uncharacterized protein
MTAVRILGACACVVVAFAAASASSPAAVTGSLGVTMTVASATEVDTSGCAPSTEGITTIGLALPGVPALTTDDCVIGYGSTNDTVRLQAYQEDGTGTAMAGPGDRTTTWTTLPTGVGQHLRALTALPDGRIWASGYGATLIYSANGGTSWTPQANPADNVLRDLYAVDGNVIWGTGWTGNVIRTIDGGTNWTQVGKVAPVGTTDVRGGVRALDAQTAWVGATAGRIFKTVDGGASWVQQNTGAGDQFWGMDLVGSSTLWAVGESGQIVRTLNGGTNWTVQRTVPGEHLYRVDALDANNVVAAGALGLVVQTTNGGATWNVIPTPTTNTLDGVVMFSTSHWMIVGYSGTILETTNAGATWQTLVSGTGNDLRALWAPDPVSIWAVGEGGMALRAPVTPIDDYDDAGNKDFATATAGFFGACLRAVEAGATTDAGTWTTNASCTASDGAWWRKIPPTSASPGTIVSRTTAPTPVGTPARVRVRFALRPPLDAAPGSYRARLTFLVTAPG